MEYKGTHEDFLKKLVKGQNNKKMSGMYELTLYYDPKTEKIWLNRTG
jgi:hypothetical protein